MTTTTTTTTTPTPTQNKNNSQLSPRCSSLTCNMAGCGFSPDPPSIYITSGYPLFCSMFLMLVTFFVCRSYVFNQDKTKHHHNPKSHNINTDNKTAKTHTKTPPLTKRTEMAGRELTVKTSPKQTWTPNPLIKLAQKTKGNIFRFFKNTYCVLRNPNLWSAKTMWNPTGPYMYIMCTYMY